jgi:hypothetical protein
MLYKILIKLLLNNKLSILVKLMSSTNTLLFYCYLFLKLDIGKVKELLHKDIQLTDNVEKMTYIDMSSVINRLQQYIDTNVQYGGTVSDKYISENKLSVKVHWANHSYDIIEFIIDFKDDLIISINVFMGNDNDFDDCDSDSDIE